MFGYSDMGSVVMLLAIFLLLVSIIFYLIRKKWLTSFISLLAFLLTTVTFVFIVVNQEFLGSVIQADNNWYNGEMNIYLQSEEEFDLDIHCKKDIVPNSPFEDDYYAYCVFDLKNDEYSILLDELKSSDEYAYKSIEEFEGFGDVNHCSKIISLENKGYERFKNSHSVRYIFSRDKKKVLFISECW